MVVLDAVSFALVLAGAFFFLAGTVSLLRFPDVYNRLHSLTKADNVGLGFVVLGLMIQTGSGGGLWRLKPAIPEGDLLVPVSRSMALVRYGWDAYASPAMERSASFFVSRSREYGGSLVRLWSIAEELESRIQLWTVAGALALLLALAVLTLSALP